MDAWGRRRVARAGRGRIAGALASSAIALSLAFGAVDAVAQERDPGRGARGQAQAPVVAAVFSTPTGKHLRVADLPPPREFVTRHKIRIRGRWIAYTATAGETYITNLAGEPVASFFSFSYVRQGPPDPKRPVLFIFNGGPGAASCWLHLGAMGPRRLVLDREVNPSNVPPFGLTDNPSSPLDVADLVFIDPVGTGFSHAVGAAQDADFAGVDADAESVARFIEAWLTKNRRYNSPKFVMGESYGSVRASVLPRALMGGVNYSGVMRGITLNGVILVGPAIGGGASAPVRPAPGQADPSVGTAIPGMAVTALYHGKVSAPGRSVAAYYDEVTRFAETDYAEAVAKERSGALPPGDRDAMAAKLAAYTGIPATVWIDHKLQLSAMEFFKLILADRGLDAGAYDSRYTLSSKNSLGDVVADDPAMTQYVPGFIAAFQQLLQNDLKVTMSIPYEGIVWEGVFNRWDNTRRGVPPTQTYAGDLATAMRRQPKMRVLVAAGYYDLLANPASLPLQAQRGGMPRDRVQFKDYESGHMLYLGNTAHQFGDDVRKFIVGASSK